jgi:hypothetical protein
MTSQTLYSDHHSPLKVMPSLSHFSPLHSMFAYPETSEAVPGAQTFDQDVSGRDERLPPRGDFRAGDHTAATLQRIPEDDTLEFGPSGAAPSDAKPTSDPEGRCRPGSPASSCTSEENASQTSDNHFLLQNDDDWDGVGSGQLTPASSRSPLGSLRQRYHADEVQSMPIKFW